MSRLEIREGAVDSYLTLSSEWQRVTLGEICRVVGGSTPDSTIDSFWNGEIVWVTPTDLGKLDKIFVTNSARQISQAGYDNCGTEMVPPGSIVMSSRAPIGYLAIAAKALCTNQGCKSFVPGDAVDSVFLYFTLKSRVAELKSLGSGATFAEVSKLLLSNFAIELPPLHEQKRIAALLTKQMAAMDQARVAAHARLQAIKALPAAYLREVFDSADANQWPKIQLSEVATLLPSKPIKTIGDQIVRAVTSACLTEFGFDNAGIKTAKMDRCDAEQAVLKEGEILVARSNTPELVGRTSVFIGEPAGIVASDLTIRIQTKESSLFASFLSAYLSSLYLRSYWKEHAGGASGTMKKITRSQISALQIPLPSKTIQESIVEKVKFEIATGLKLRSSAQAELAAIEALPATLLRRAFSGELSQSAVSRLPTPVHSLAYRAAGIAYFAQRWNTRRRRSGRLKLAKAQYGLETVAGVSLGSQFDRAPLGPYDPEFDAIVDYALAQRWIEQSLEAGQSSPTYIGGPKINEALQVLEPLLGKRRSEVERLADLMRDWDSDKAERVATLFAAWNDFLIDGKSVNDAAVILEVLTRWHPGKEQRFSAQGLQQELDAMRTVALVPKGLGPRTRGGQPSLGLDHPR